MAIPTLPARYKPALIWALYAIGLMPGLYAFYLGIFGGLGADPVRTFEHLLGLWALRFLCLGLAVTPARDLLGINLISYRRMLGLLAFYYVLAHFAVYLTLDRGMILSSILGDILKRPYIMLGMAGLVMLIPLAATSNRWSIRQLGPRWNKLHKLVYAIAAAAVLHYALSLKAVTAEPAFYIAVVTLLLGYRLVRSRLMARKRRRRNGTAGTTTRSRA
ncbi:MULTISPECIES: protein-methionine-sulfoxide reductase heme-binding subunit MsrQ [Alphaproteobacteria]|uniref:Protein-methionine-sulfoxide reductase heme-binding subunit MsrQ n=2 Tax=Alphaproteobacteria TaxID=28211 RepID=A0A512HNX4_9HYPH|nr:MULTISPECIES: protein-methionine-sulfoxide reductase heme-binding subunit MsrQ [Alphaproteobacteria]GEO87158.1 protein-methionine-sulfoxide reductase heme-binding subunit MsrQ [Ciceribacter naphthalenivorans]GLR23262.1 protein-methionine-sulfoxide reductase heme-binding subunit MsrQ [Ciceribacter naphthalenivorans]GLT06118.1 protein-methionine-sulfoxide reductase heme-binding subunit MsrQ [Sphingomonas psychrolutea]